MSQIPTLVLHPRFDEDSQLLWQAAVTRGWPVVRARGYMSPVHGGQFESDSLTIYGGYMWAAEMAAGSGVKLLSPPDDWLIQLGEKWTRRRIWLSTVGQVREGSFPVFVKSLRGKQLNSRVYHHRDDLPDVGDDVEVLAQEPVKWNFEYRCFVTWQGVRTFSRYATFGELDVIPADKPISTDVEAGVIEFMGGLLTQWPSLDQVPSWTSAGVVDVGLIHGRGWAIVEANPAWCSGIYGCDPGKVLDVVAASCLNVRGDL